MPIRFRAAYKGPRIIDATYDWLDQDGRSVAWIQVKGLRRGALCHVVVNQGLRRYYKYRPQAFLAALERGEVDLATARAVAEAVEQTIALLRQR